MSYEEFRRRIDTARNILVGAVPSPAGQIDQITYALMYKFMNDLDDQSVALGGNRTYFNGDYARYNWHELMSAQLGAHERLELYRQAVQTMAKNPGLPPLFQEIYQNAFLPFNSANVLSLFLKEIDKFNYGEGDDIGDTYEYLLSITGAQGDVGQFRTPRHIIKFIAEAVNPGKDDTVLDPAVGTAGFLIAAYNHVKAQHDGVDENGEPNDEKSLSSDERSKLHKNYHGFDIDPTMVRTASVNMYLHGFTTPDIHNHDTLSQEDYWDNRYDVILANPPFMSPKGGIQPHKKFGINANRAEVLFVDYIASHINPVSGRAGIVVPEGIIFQSGNAYKQLRKNLVEHSLYAVVSLPAGVFQPYSGVKTSILLLDKKLAKERDDILFIKIDNDGYSLGAQRKLVAGEQFTEALELITEFKTGTTIESPLAHAVSRKEIAQSNDYNLSGDRYKSQMVKDDFEYDFVDLGEIVDVVGGSTPLKTNEAFWVDGTIPWFTIEDIRRQGRYIDKTSKYITEEALNKTSVKLVPKNSVLLCCTASVGEYAITEIPLTTNQQFNALVVKDGSRLLPRYLFWAVSDFKEKLEKMAGKTSFSFVSAGTLKKMQIPLPAYNIQHKVAAELDSYQRIIDAAQTIIKDYKPTIKINSNWTKTSLKELFEGLEAGVSVNSENRQKTENEKGILKTSSVTYGIFIPEEHKTILNSELSRAKVHPRKDSIIISRMNTPALVGASAYVTDDRNDLYLPDRLWQTVRSRDDFLVQYVFYVISSPEYRKKITQISGGTSGSMKNISKKAFMDIVIPLPSLEVQQQIVSELETEQELIDANKRLIEIYQAKIKSKLAEIWNA